MRTFTAQFVLPGNIGIGKMDPDSAQAQKLLSEQITSNFLAGNAQLTQVNEFFTELDDHSGEKDDSTEFATIVDINLCLNEAEGRNYLKHKELITRKAVETLRNSKMFLSYLWQKKNTEHIGLETIFV
ncbi:hypothetical protein [Flavobacterium caeni]|uniref:Uncharacterized protein n=1 Tax=Flavobacterium caeni TaxID=490189 RepID=A0A1G5ATU2_9FLAO|nr:hypothetical protein [Flavobacterium caeni]SCX81325.1 hypothetical protein SAMN02927903_00152 [Flavobacterium caeni]